MRTFAFTTKLCASAECLPYIQYISSKLCACVHCAVHRTKAKDENHRQNGPIVLKYKVHTETLLDAKQMIQVNENGMEDNFHTFDHRTNNLSWYLSMWQFIQLAVLITIATSSNIVTQNLLFPSFGLWFMFYDFIKLTPPQIVFSIELLQ